MDHSVRLSELRMSPQGPARLESLSASGTPSASETPYIIVHRVQCNRSNHSYHHDHAHQLDYLDVPRLLAHENQSSMLKGTVPLRNIEWYLEDNTSKHLAIINIYDCVKYHEEIADEFERFSLPAHIDSRAFSQIRPYLHILKEDAREAKRTGQIIMLSSGLERALSSLQRMHPLGLPNWDPTNDLIYPYPQLWHCKDILHDAAKKLTPKEKPHIMALWRFLDEAVSDEWNEAEGMFDNGIVSKQHWTKLFRPNEPIVTVLSGEPQAFIFKGNTRVSDNTLSLDCWSWEFDGSFYIRDLSVKIVWSARSGMIPITELSHYPLRCNTSGLTGRLHKRGAKFWACRHKKFIGYNVSSRDTSKQVAQQRYMVDMSTYEVLHESKPQSPPPRRLDESVTFSDELPDESLYPYFSLLLPPKIKGFGFHDKKWIDLSVERTEDIHWNRDVFTNDLVLDEGKKELIQALVTVHLRGTTKMKADFMANKGEGLLILLHGGPGTGKTLTAESVAELAARPLYRVTCGDIGTNAEEVEKYLDSVLYIGVNWNCVVLLDEADVFLEERTKLDLQRNALVSVFLRVLEYYNGILILTSNRIGTFDEAFKSRVQLSLHYPPLRQEHRFRIWENFVALLETGPDALDCSEIRCRLSSLARHNLNGRQIRNTMNTARQLAQYKNELFGYRHLNLAIQNVLDFENYVTTLRDQTDEEWAQEQGLRQSNKKRKVEDDLE